MKWSVTKNGSNRKNAMESMKPLDEEPCLFKVISPTLSTSSAISGDRVVQSYSSQNAWKSKTNYVSKFGDPLLRPRRPDPRSCRSSEYRPVDTQSTTSSKGSPCLTNTMPLAQHPNPKSPMAPVKDPQTEGHREDRLDALNDPSTPRG